MIDHPPLQSNGDALLKRAIAGAKIVFDIGANRGLFSRSYPPAGSIIHAYEPVPSMYEELVKVPHIHAHQLAVGERIGRLENVSVFNAWSLLPHDTKRERALGFAGEPPFSCDVTTVDAEVEKHGDPSFLKIDVDGYEYRALKGAIKTLQRLKPTVMIEYSYLPTLVGDSVMEMVSFIYDLGYQMWSMDGYCAETWRDAWSFYPAHTSYDVMLLHRELPL